MLLVDAPFSAFAHGRRGIFNASIIARRQATQIHSASSPIKILHHRFNSEPSTDFGDDDLQPVAGTLNFILRSPAMLLLDGVLNLYKPTHNEAPLHHCYHATPLQQFAGDLRSGDLFF
jgi:hypothetical protein